MFLTDVNWVLRMILVVIEIASAGLLVYFAWRGHPTEAKKLIWAIIGIIVGTAGLTYMALHPPTRPAFTPPEANNSD